jgi:hypothetical protein
MSSTEGVSTVAQLLAQWTNPNDVLSLLLIIGGDIVQTALAQTTAGGWISPVCFSFGWVAYSFSTLVRVLGDGRLLPPPDFPAKVFNLESSYVRENKNWVLGRILRDNELFMNKIRQHGGNGLRISIYTALARKDGKETANFYTLWLWAGVTALQIGIATIPFARDREWGVFLVTCSGIAASILAGAIPQWQVEKIPLKKRSRKLVALTSGNGSRDIMIIYGDGVALDLEEMAAGESPRSDRVWEALKLFSSPVKNEFGVVERRHNKTEIRTTHMFNGLPLGVWLTRFASFCQVVFWLALLIMVAGLKSHSWYLVVVGSVGMLQNAMLAAAARRPDRRGLPLALVDTIVTHRVMDGLMDLDATIENAGLSLRDEFFPGFLREDEKDWWDGERDAYDNIRVADKKRGIPRSRQRKKHLGIPDIDTTGKAFLYRRASTMMSAMSSDTMSGGPRSRSTPPMPVMPLVPENLTRVGTVGEEMSEVPTPKGVTVRFLASRPFQEIVPLGSQPSQERLSTRSSSESSVRTPGWA